MYSIIAQSQDSIGQSDTVSASLTITNSGRLLPKEEILEQVGRWAAKNQPKLSDAEVEAFLTRTLQKLSGKKKLLGTHHSGLRRGYHYGLIDWFFQSSGKLRRQHYDRLVLSPEEKKG